MNIPSRKRAVSFSGVFFWFFFGQAKKNKPQFLMRVTTIIGLRLQLALRQPATNCNMAKCYAKGC
jgi:hypothetical protein